MQYIKTSNIDMPPIVTYRSRKPRKGSKHQPIKRTIVMTSEEIGYVTQSVLASMFGMKGF